MVTHYIYCDGLELKMKMTRSTVIPYLVRFVDGLVSASPFRRKSRRDSPAQIQNLPLIWAEVAANIAKKH